MMLRGRFRASRARKMKSRERKERQHGSQERQEQKDYMNTRYEVGYGRMVRSATEANLHDEDPFGVLKST